jgi:CheY-like chemotaxis protein
MSIWILVVDDENDIEMLFRQQFRRELRQGRFVMEFSLSAGEALERLGHMPDDADLILILSDINMPGMTGLELLPRIKALKPELPVIMITAYADTDTKRRALEIGAEDLLTKPIDFGVLKADIDARVAARELRA